MKAYRGQVLRVDLQARKARVETFDAAQAHRWIGGRGFNVSKLYDEVPFDVDPLAPENWLYIGVGPLNGTSFPCAARVNFSARSPQTGILGDSNAGCALGPELKYAGYDQVVLEGACETWSLLFITNDGVRFLDATELRGLDALETQVRVQEMLGGDRIRVAAIGPAAEAGVLFSGIFSSGARAGARTGMGRLLAAKRIKAIAVRGDSPVEVADPARFQAHVAALDQRIREHPGYAARLRMGTTFLVTALNGMGCLSTRHYQEGVFEDAALVSGECLADTVKLKGRGCYSCTIPCSRVYSVQAPDGSTVVGEGPEFEGLAGFSSKVGCNDLGAALQACDRCNRLGLDIITTSEAVAWSMELVQRGLLSPTEADGLDLRWGNTAAVLALIEKIGKREGLGDLLGDGVPAAARKLGRGSELVMHVKGLEIFQADPRGIQGYALGVAVASRGGDHLRAEPSFEFSGNAAEGERLYGSAESATRLGVKGKGRLVKDFEERCALSDCLNVCKNTLVNMELLLWDETAEVLRAATGLDWDGEAIRESSERIVNLERLYLGRLGLGRADDTHADRFLREPMPDGPSKGQVVHLEPMLDEYYAARGWNLETGHPEPATLARLGLD
jgi:aldehyde:ferredoxin oxidoreductase